jgi:hypothetical protein
MPYVRTRRVNLVSRVNLGRNRQEKRPSTSAVGKVPMFSLNDFLYSTDFYHAHTRNDREVDETPQPQPPPMQPPPADPIPPPIQARLRG